MTLQSLVLTLIVVGVLGIRDYDGERTSSSVFLPHLEPSSTE